MLTNMRPLLDLKTYQEGDVIFDEGIDAEDFFMLKRGKVLLEKKISETVTVSLGAIKPGYSFGWSSICGDPFTMIAVCGEPSEIFTAKGEKILDLLSRDSDMGFRMMRSLTRVIKNRLDRMEEQFLHAIKDHPDMKSLFDEE
jgi:CRP-like cAMP-binding protein